MADEIKTPKQRNLAGGLLTLSQLQKKGKKVFRGKEFPRRQLGVLTDAGFLRPMIKGWYVAARPGEAPGDTTPWHAAMRDFIVAYCDHRFGETWHLSPVDSLREHAGATAPPKQIVVHAPAAANNTMDLPDLTSLFTYRDREAARGEQLEVIRGMRVLALPLALTRAPGTFFKTYPTDAQVALGNLKNAAELSRELLSGGHGVVAGRLIGALRAVGRGDIAAEIAATMKAAGYSVVESDPFDVTPHMLENSRPSSPYRLRMEIMWSTMRPQVARIVPAQPGLPSDPAKYLSAVDEAYTTDAYHSLSIEGYQVTDDLINRVAAGAWNPEKDEDDANTRNAMAALGYRKAFLAVQQSLANILRGDNAGEVVRADHNEWYRALFGPSVTAGLMKASDLAGYRNAQVYIRNARHVPPPREAVSDMMYTLFDLLAREGHPGVRAVLGHFFFVFIHPYMDGNGRIGRFLMNALMCSGGYPWTIIRVERREEYMSALDSASGDQDIVPFTEFIVSCIGEAKAAGR